MLQRVEGVYTLDKVRAEASAGRVQARASVSTAGAGCVHGVCRVCARVCRRACVCRLTKGVCRACAGCVPACAGGQACAGL